MLETFAKQLILYLMWTIFTWIEAQDKNPLFKFFIHICLMTGAKKFMVEENKAGRENVSSL
jgi:hypothetical protein